MRLQLIAIFSSLTLLSACATDPETATNVGGGGNEQVAAAAAAPAPTASAATARTDTQDYLLTNVGDRVFFGLDKSDISAEAAAVLGRQAAWLNANPAIMITVEGHADERGTREYNLALGERRANSVKEFLMSQGVSADRVGTISYGKERPQVVGNDESAWSQNRRGVTTLVSGFSN